MDKQIYYEAYKSSSPMTKRLLNELLKLEDENKKLTANLDDENKERYCKDLNIQEASQREKREKLEKKIHEHIAKRAKDNNELAKLWLDTQSLMAEEKKQKELNLQYSEEIEKLKTSIKNRKDEKDRIDKIIHMYNDCVELIDKNSKKLDLFGKEVLEACNLKSEKEKLSNAINKVEKAIKEIWNLVNKDKFDEYLHRR